MLLQDYCEEHRTEHEEKAIKKAQNVRIAQRHWKKFAIVRNLTKEQEKNI